MDRVDHGSSEACIFDLGNAPAKGKNVALVDKPAAGSWTEHAALDTELVSFEDSISPAHYELEREAIFRKTWLNVGRVEQLPRVGSYYTKELDVLRTSIIVVRDREKQVRVFHNM